MQEKTVTTKKKPSKEIDLAFYPEGYKGLDIFIEDFWSVHVHLKGNVNGEASFNVHLGADKKDEVLLRAKCVLHSLKSAARRKK